MMGSELKTEEGMLNAVAETVPDNSVTLGKSGLPTIIVVGKSGYIHISCINPVAFIYNTRFLSQYF